MFIIGITGKSGSGKTTLAKEISKELNCEYIDIDKIGHEATNNVEILENLCTKFGREIIDENNKLNRKKLGNLVFSSKQKMDELTEITWGYMKRKLDNILKKKQDYLVLEWTLLPKVEYWNKCNYKILVEADANERKEKVLKRDNITDEYFNKRDSASIDYSNIEFDYTLKNDYNIKTIERVAKEIVNKKT